MAAEVLPGQLDVDEVLELVVRDERHPEPAALSGELVAPADELRWPSRRAATSTGCSGRLALAPARA